MFGPGQHSKPVDPLSEEESSRLLTHAKDELGGILFLITFLLNTGLRVGEVRHVVWNDLITNAEPRAEIRVDPTWTKNKLGRVLPATTKLQAAIITHHFACTNNAGPVFSHNWPALPGFRKRGWSVRQMERIVSDLGKEACGRRVTPHTLRHTFATRLLKVTDLRTIQMMLGHIWLNSTQIYTHPTLENMREAMEKL